MFERVSSIDTTLVIRHMPGSNPASFQVMRLRDGKTTEPVSPLSPHGFPVEGRPKSDLLRELQWYLETFLDYPFPPETEHADRVLKALTDWGKQTFQALFDNRSAGRMFEAATSGDYSRLTLQISSDDARVLAWPWEALRDAEVGVLAHTCQIERRLNKIRDPERVPGSLPNDQVNILLVVARPYGEGDVGFRSIARLLVELIEEKKLPAHVELLRPPTFDQLREHLRQRPGFYHILHFDGHGRYSVEIPGTGGHTFQGREGKLVFETEAGEPDPITAEKLSSLLKEHAVPGVVLNACQSAMVDGDADDPFSSVATSLLKSGIGSVVAMAYSLYVSGAQQFLPSFYRRLFEQGSMAEAVRAGRQQMFREDKRVCVRGKFPLQDWLLPVLYQQDPLNFSFATEAHKTFVPQASKLPEELRRQKNTYGFVGRDSAILAMERAMRRPPAGILIQGLGGVGKTTLARGFLQWLDSTGGLGEGCFWLGFQEIRSAEYVFNRLGETLFGGQFATVPIDQKIEALASEFYAHRFIIVWDNFESAAGIPGTAVTASLPESDRKLLSDFLDKLRGGASKVIITSRSSEDWLGTQRRFLLPLGGMDREERWEYCEVILRDLGLTINRNDEKLVALMNLLGGHPLAMRAILPRLEKLTAGQVAEALQSNLTSLRMEGDANLAQLYATLAFVEQSLPKDLQPLLIPIAMHEGYISDVHLQFIAQNVDPTWAPAMTNALMQGLVSAGLLRDLGQAIYEMHPVLTGYLRYKVLGETLQPIRDLWAKAFADVMGRTADSVAHDQWQQQRIWFELYGQNFYYALGEAERLGMETATAALIQSLAFFARRTRNFVVATRLLESQAEKFNLSGNRMGEAFTYQQLGTVAHEQRDYAAAKQSYRRAIAIFAGLNIEEPAAETYLSLGIVAEEERDFAAAEHWYSQSLAIDEKQGDERGAARTYHQMGSVGQKRRDFTAAENWYRRSLAISERLNIQEYLAGTYHNLGTLAEEQRDFISAEKWHRKSLAIKERLGDISGAATTQHQLGRVAEELHDFDAAERWYLSSLGITERLRIEEHSAITYQQLGRIAQKRNDFGAADQWYRKSLTIKEKQGNRHGAAFTYHQLGTLAATRGDFLTAGRWLINGTVAFLENGDTFSADRCAHDFIVSYNEASPANQENLKALWDEAKLGEFRTASQEPASSNVDIDQAKVASDPDLRGTFRGAPELANADVARIDTDVSLSREIEAFKPLILKKKEESSIAWADERPDLDADSAGPEDPSEAEPRASAPTTTVLPVTGSSPPSSAALQGPSSGVFGSGSPIPVPPPENRDSQDEPDPPRSAYALLKCADAVVAEIEFALMVGLAKDPDPDICGDQKMVRPASSLGPYTLQVQIVADGFMLRTRESWRNELRVTVENPYPQFMVHLTPEMRLKQNIWSRNIQAIYSVDGHTIGVAIRSVAIVQSKHYLDQAIALAQDSSTTFSIPTDAVPPDLTVSIVRGESEGRLQWTLATPWKDIPVPDVPMLVVVGDAGDSPKDFARQLVDSVNAHEGKQSLYSHLMGRGLEIGDKIPDQFWDALRLASQKSRTGLPTILILSEEPYIPWELAVLKPPLNPDLPPFLGAQAVVGRWVLAHRGPKLPPPCEQHVKAIAVVSGIYSNVPGWKRLQQAEEEASEIEYKWNGVHVDAATGPVLKCIKGVPAGDLLHFALHGNYDPNSTLNGLILVDGEPLDPTTVKGSNLAGTPFIFLNACQVGQGNAVLGDYAGMAAAFLYAGASGVVAPLWSIKDTIAKEIALSFYSKTFIGTAPAEFLRSERSKFQDSSTTISATCLAYQFFGHPAMRLVRELVKDGDHNADNSESKR